MTPPICSSRSAGAGARPLRHHRALVGHDADRVPLDPPGAADQRLAVGGLVLVELAAVEQPGQHLVGVVRARAVDRHQAVEILGRIERLDRLAAGEGGLGGHGELGELAADLLQAGGVVRVAVVHHPRDVALHEGAAQLLVVDLLADRRLHQVGAGEEDRARPLHDVRLVAHDRQIGAAGHAGAHDGGHLEDPLGREAGVVEEGAAEVLLVGEDLVLERQEDAGRVDQIDDRQPVLEGDLLRAQHLLGGQREPGAGLDGGVVGDHDHVAAMDLADADHHPGRRGAAILLIEPLGHPEAQLQEARSRIAQRLDPLARRHLPLGALLVLRLQAAAEADAVLLLADLLDPPPPVLGLPLERLTPIDLALQNRHEVLPRKSKPGDYMGSLVWL